jgi:hypothetical protein
MQAPCLQTQSIVTISNEGVGMHGAISWKTHSPHASRTFNVSLPCKPSTGRRPYLPFPAVLLTAVAQDKLDAV